MKKFLIIKNYVQSLSAIIEAENEEQANELFDELPTELLREDYIGLLDDSIKNSCEEVSNKDDFIPFHSIKENE